MCDMFFCFSGDPVEDDPRAGNTVLWKIPMKDAPCANPTWFCFGAFCGCCALYPLRMQSIDNDMQNYTCCQGQIQCCGFPYKNEPGDCLGERGNSLCLCVELCCCYGCALSGTRFHLQDKLSLRSDPCDYKIMRFNNFMQILRCCVVIAAAATDIQELDEAAFIIDIIADIVFYVTSGCMIAQIEYQLNDTKKAVGAPTAQVMQKF